MTRRILIVLLMLLLTVTASPVGLMQSSGAGSTKTDMVPQDWQGLADLKPGKKVLVEFKANLGEAVEGKFVGVNGDKLILTRDGYPVSLLQKDIQTVYRLKGKWSRESAARVGALLGLVAGAFVGAAIAVRSNSDEPDSIVTGPGFGALAGAGIAALAFGKRKGEVLYEAK